MSHFSFLNPAKDYALEVAVKLWFHQTQKRYGQMTNIQIDSTAKSIRVELELKGESAPLFIDVASYQLSTESGETFIELGEIKNLPRVDQPAHQRLLAAREEVLQGAKRGKDGAVKF